MLRSTGLRAALGAVIAVACLATAPVAHADRAFTPRFTANDTGDIVGLGNTLMTCKASANGCAAARSHGPTTTSDSTLNNDNWDMTYVDVDDDDDTFNSSRANLTVPAGAQVLWAGLYWGGDSSGSGDKAPPSAADRNKVKLKVAGAPGYTTLTGALDTATVSPTQYFQGFKDVTALVSAAGSGTYTVADVQAGTGPKHFAGWSLIVVYRDTSEPARNLTVFDGLQVIRSNDPPTTINVSGFRTPPAGTVKTELGLVTYEGDLGIVGDTASLNGHALSDPQHPQTNYFDSSLSRDGSALPGRNPSYANQFGFDVTFQNADGLLGNDATSAAIRVTTSGDQYVPGVITFATELFAPRIEQTKSVVDVNGGDVEPGDVLQYTIAGRNSGQDAATGFVLRDPIPAKTSYLPGSLAIVDGGGATPGPQTDASGDDLAESDGGRVTFRLGGGASAATGGRLAIGGTYEVRFSVTVDAGTSSATKITNVATASFASEILGTPLTAVSDAAVTVTAPSTPPSADVSITKVADNPNPHAGDVVTYTLTAHNAGADAATGVKITDALPDGVTFLSASAPCTHAGVTVTCDLGTLAAGASKTVTINATADPLPGGSGGGSVATDAHLVGVEKVERQVDLQAGETATVDLACPQAGQILTDASVRADAVDQGTGTLASVRVLSAHTTAVGGWQAVVRNDSSGRAQAKAFGVCVAGTTTAAAGHQHPLVVSDPVTVTQSLAAGRQQVELTCAPGTAPIVPGWSLSGGSATVQASEPTAGGWRLVLLVDQPTDATLSVRCLDRQVAPADGHTHDLELTHVVKQVTVPAGQTVEADVVCADDAKGIVGTWELPDGVLSLGNDPRPKTRAFKLLNPTGQDAAATVDLECLADRTGPGHAAGAAPREVTNTATIASATADPQPANNSAGATVTVTGTGLTLAKSPAVVSAKALTLRVACPTGGAACRGTLSVAAGGRQVARGGFRLAAGQTKRVRLRLRHDVRRSAKVTMQLPGGRAVTRTVRVQR